jgi:hypothetical protein
VRLDHAEFIRIVGDRDRDVLTEGSDLRGDNRDSFIVNDDQKWPTRVRRMIDSSAMNTSMRQMLPTRL